MNVSILRTGAPWIGCMERLRRNLKEFPRATADDICLGRFWQGRIEE